MSVCFPSTALGLVGDDQLPVHHDANRPKESTRRASARPSVSRPSARLSAIAAARAEKDIPTDASGASRRRTTVIDTFLHTLGFDSSQKDPEMNDAERFSQEYGKEMGSTQEYILVTAFIMLVVGVMHLILTGDAYPGWRSLTPCTFQAADVISQLQHVSSAIALAERILSFIPLVLLIVVLGRNWHRGVLEDPREFPLRVIVGSWLWSTLVVLLIYSTINIKVLTEYEVLTRVSCEVTASLLFFPPGINSSAIVSQQAANFRATAAGYFNNSRNHYYRGGTYDGMEAHLAHIDMALDQTLVDDSDGCDQSQPESSTSSVTLLYRHIQPTDDTAIDGYCTQSSAIAMHSNSPTRPTFPLETLLTHIEDVGACAAP